MQGTCILVSAGAYGDIDWARSEVHGEADFYEDKLTRIRMSFIGDWASEENRPVREVHLAVLPGIPGINHVKYVGYHSVRGELHPWCLLEPFAWSEDMIEWVRGLPIRCGSSPDDIFHLAELPARP